MKHIVAIVVTYNRCSLLLECIQALKNSEGEMDILIINNASTDNTEEICRTFSDDPGVKYYNTGKNLGGAGGFHYGIKKAYELGYSYFWLMDDDTIVEKNSLSAILTTAKNVGDNYGFISSLAQWIDGTPCVMNWHEIASDWDKNKNEIAQGIVKIQCATFVSLFIRREVVEKVGLPIKQYFIWGDDTEYCYRISRQFPCYLSSQSVVLHKMQSNEGTNLLQMIDPNRIERIYYSIRNDCCTSKKRGFGQFLKFSKNWLKKLGAVLFKRNKYKCKKIKILLKGYFGGLFFNPKIDFVD